MTQFLQTKTGVTAFIGLVQVSLEGLQIAKEGDDFIAYGEDGAKLGPIVEEHVKFNNPETEKVSKVKLTSLVAGIDPETLLGKNFATMSDAEKAVYVKHLEALAADKISTATSKQAADKPKKAEAAKATKSEDDSEDQIPVPTTLAELKKIGVKDQIKLAIQEGVEGINSRTKKGVVESKLAEALELVEKEDEKPADNKPAKSKVLKSDAELEEDDEDEEEEEEEENEDDDIDEDEDEDEIDDEDEDEDDDSDDDSDEDEDDEDDDSDEDDDDDQDEDEDEDDEDSNDDDSDEDDDEDEDDQDDEDEDEDEDEFASVRKKWTPAKIDKITDKTVLNSLRKEVGVTYKKDEKVSPVRVKEDIKAVLFGKKKK